MIRWISLLTSILAFLSPRCVAQTTQQELSVKLVEHLEKKQYRQAQAMLDPSVRKSLKTRDLQEIWKNFEQHFGPYQGHLAPLEHQLEEGVSTETTLQFENNGLLLKLHFAGERMEGIWFSPFEYVLPEELKNLSFGKEQLLIGKDSIELPAEVILPRSGSQFPLVVLVHGSGPNDMDESLGPNKVFRDIALMLAKRGIATLRYDKRSAVYPEWFSSGKHWTLEEETIEDALSAVERAKLLPFVDSSRIYLLGHSLGAYAAPLIASRSGDIAGAIMIAGPNRPIYELLPEQYRYLLGLDGRLSPKERMMIRRIDKSVERLRNAEKGEKPKKASELADWPTTFFTDLAGYVPASLMDSLSVPFLVLQGELDYQVSFERDFLPMKSALENKENSHIRFKSFPQTDHLMMDCGDHSEPADYYRPRHVRTDVIEVITSWIFSN